MTLRVACVQFRSSQNVEENCARARHLIEHVSREGPDIVLLPDHLFYLGPLSQYHKYAHPLDTHPWLIQLQNWAREFNTTLVAGTIPERSPRPEEPKIFQTAAVISPTDAPIFLRKRLLLKGIFEERCFDEGRFVARGPADFLTFGIKGWRVGVALCVELRYAPIFHSLRYRHHCDLVLIPASFYYSTGQLHWLTLLQSRAIEFQFFVAAANQCGRPDEAVPVFTGQSAIIDPWGRPASVASVTGEALCLQDLHKENVLTSRVRVDTAYNINELQPSSQELI